MFDVHQFLLRFDWPLFRPAAALNPFESRNKKKIKI